MVEIPYAQQQTSFSAPQGGVAIPDAHSQIWNQLTNWSANNLEEIAAQRGESAGALAQSTAENQDQLQKPSMFDRFTTYGKTYAKAALQLFGIHKQEQLSVKAIQLNQENPNNPDAVRSGMEEFKQTWMDGIPSDNGGVFRKLFNEFQTRAIVTAETEKAQAAHNERIATAFTDIQSMEARRDIAIREGRTPAEVAELSAKISESYKALVQVGVNPLKIKEMMDTSRLGVVMSEGLRSVRSGNFGVIDAYKKGGGPDWMTFEQREKMIAVLTGEQREMQRGALLASAKQRSDLSRDLKDELSRRQETGQSTPGFEQRVKTVLANDPDKAADILGVLNLATKSFEDKETIAGQSLDQDMAYLASIKPKPDTPNFAFAQARYKDVEAKIAEKHRTLASDPASYVLKTFPQLGELLQNPETQQSGLDLLADTQRTLGVQNPRLLTKEQAASTVAGITSKNPVEGSNALIALQQQYREHFPQVFGQLIRDGKLPDQYKAIMLADGKLPGDDATRRDMAEAIMNRKTIEDTVRTSKPGKLSEVDEAVNRRLEPFRTSLLASGANDDNYGAYREGITDLARYYVARGDTPDTAAKKAARIIYDRLDFSNPSGFFAGSPMIPTYFAVPKGLLPKAELAVRQIELGLKPSDLKPIPVDPMSTRTSEEAQADYLATKDTWRWVTNHDGSGVATGVILLDGKMSPVLLRDGTPVTRTYSQIARMISDEDLRTRAMEQSPGQFGRRPAPKPVTPPPPPSQMVPGQFGRGTR